MQAAKVKSEAVAQAVFTVCVGEDVSTAALEAAGAFPGTEFIGQFQEYITAERKPQFPDAILEATGCVALIDCDRDSERALETMTRLQAAFANRLHLIAVSSKADAEFLVRAMRTGCEDFLARPIDVDLLKAALKRFQARQFADPPSARGKGKAIAIYGVKGGVGTTTIAVHLANHLVRKHNKKVLLIDHKHELGHVSLHLGLKESVYHFDELVRNVDRLDADLLNGFVTRHSSGLEVIPSPDSCGPMPVASTEAVGRVLDYLRGRYDFILFDSSLQQQANVTALIECCDEVALVSTPDVVALRDLVRRIEHLGAISTFPNKLRLIVNRSTSDDAVSSADIVAAAKFPIAHSIPNNYADLMRAVNAGEPIPPQQRGAFSQAFAQWTNQLVPNADKAAAPVSELKRRFYLRF
jgi:pilus assembly protein CpaE